jgi:hypothetical protein
MSRVPSVEPSSTRITSSERRVEFRRLSRHSPTYARTLYAGTTTLSVGVSRASRRLRTRRRTRPAALLARAERGVPGVVGERVVLFATVRLALSVLCENAA